MCHFPLTIKYGRIDYQVTSKSDRIVVSLKKSRSPFLSLTLLPPNPALLSSFLCQPFSGNGRKTNERHHSFVEYLDTEIPLPTSSQKPFQTCQLSHIVDVKY